MWDIIPLGALWAWMLGQYEKAQPTSSTIVNAIFNEDSEGDMEFEDDEIEEYVPKSFDRIL